MKGQVCRFVKRPLVFRREHLCLLNTLLNKKPCASKIVLRKREQSGSDAPPHEDANATVLQHWMVEEEVRLMF